MEILCMKDKILIENETLSIVMLNKSMAFDIWQNSLDEDNRKFVPDEVFETIEEADSAIEYLISCYNNEEGPFIYPVMRKEDHTNIGYVQLVKIKDGWEIGYHIAKKYTNHGYASMSVKLFLEYLKSHKDIKEIYGIALSRNKASVRVLEKCGFKLIFEGYDMYQGRKRKIVKTIRKI